MERLRYIVGVENKKIYRLALGLLLGTEAPVMTLNGIDFSL